MSQPSPPTPHEPEIETLGRIARRALVVLRGISILAGAAAVGWAVFLFAEAPGEPPPPEGFGGHGLVGMGIAWLCAGVPLLLPVGFVFGRGRWPLLALGAALWLSPGLLLDEHELMFLLRLFASLVAVAVLAVWRTLFGLTAAGAKG